MRRCPCLRTNEHKSSGVLFRRYSQDANDAGKLVSSPKINIGQIIGSVSDVSHRMCTNLSKMFHKEKQADGRLTYSTEVMQGAL